MVDLSIIIISYNTKEITKNCLESVGKSLKDAPFNYEVIVIDNASTDASVQELTNFKFQTSNFKLVKNKKNIGFGPANNQGAKLATGKYLLFLNSDTVVLDIAISRLYTGAVDNPDKHFLGGKLLNKDITPQPSCGPFYTLPVIFGSLFLKGDYWGLTRYSPNKIKKVDWISGACILTKKEYFEKLEGFDEKIFMYMEEIDLLLRAKQAGYSTYFYPAAQFIHLGSASSGQRTYPILQVYRGFLYLYKKHFSKLALFWLKTMLKLKADISIFIGRISRNNYLINTYEEAKKLVTLD